MQIAYRNISIEPDTVRVKVGSTIRWTNYDSLQANVTSDQWPAEFASKNFGEGGTFEIKAEQARRDPLRVHAVPRHHEWRDRSGQLNSGRPCSGVDAVA